MSKAYKGPGTQANYRVAYWLIGQPETKKFTKFGSLKGMKDYYLSDDVGLADQDWDRFMTGAEFIVEAFGLTYALAHTKDEYFPAFYG